MTAVKSPSEQHEGFVEILSLLELNIRYLEALGFGEATIQDYRKVLAYLRSRSPAEVAKILGSHAKTRRPKSSRDPELTDEEIRRLKPEKIAEFLSAEEISRPFLERLASVRFGVTKGGLSMLRSRGALKEKIETLVSHEGTHDVISKVASGRAGSGMD